MKRCFLHRLALNYLILGIVVGIGGCEKAPQPAPASHRPKPSPPLATAPGLPSESASTAGRAIVPMPFAEECRAFLEAMKSAVPLGSSYPIEPNIYVSLELDGVRHITTALGAAVWQGDRTQIEKYLAAGAGMNHPTWFKAGANPPVLSSAAHMAINAVYLKRAQVDFTEFILSRGADANGVETSFSGKEDMPANWSQRTLLFHAVTSEIPELVKTVLQHGIKDTNAGAVDPKATMSPLFTAILRHNVDIAKLLLASGADPNRGMSNSSGRTQSAANLAEEMFAREKDGATKEKARVILAIIQGQTTTQ